MLLCAAVWVYKSVCVFVRVGCEWESLGDRKEDKAAGRERTSGVCLLTGQVNDSWGLNSETVLAQAQRRKLIYPLLTRTCSVVLVFLYVCQWLILIPSAYVLHIWKQLCSFPKNAKSTLLQFCHCKNHYFPLYQLNLDTWSAIKQKCASLCLNGRPPVCIWIGETCLCGAKGGAACQSVPQWARGPWAHGGAEDKGTEGSRVTSCPCVDETMPSVNKPKLAVITEVGWTKGKHLKCNLWSTWVNKKHISVIWSL